jgi:hypothetical protein
VLDASPELEDGVGMGFVWHDVCLSLTNCPVSSLPLILSWILTPAVAVGELEVAALRWGSGRIVGLQIQTRRGSRRVEGRGQGRGGSQNGPSGVADS